MNKKFFIIGLLTLLLLVGTAMATTDDAVAYYSFDNLGEGATGDYYGVTGTSSGIDFDGTDDWIDLGTFSPSYTDTTYTGWFKSGSTSGSNRIWSQGTSTSGSSQPYFDIVLNNGDFVLDWKSVV